MQHERVLRDRFLESMSRASFTVSVATSDGAAGRAGITVSAMTSVAADPPILLVCVNRQSHMAAVIDANARFAVNVLAGSQQEIADTFAGRRDDRRDMAERFACGRWSKTGGGMPMLEEAVAVFDCRLDAIHPMGTHLIVCGLVEAATIGDDQPPLLHHRRGYGVPDLF